MNRYSLLLAVLCTFSYLSAFGQYKYEREHRIKKSQFPAEIHEFIAAHLQNTRKMRYYREIDSNKINYKAKFKRDRLHYSMEFIEQGRLKDIEFLIKEVDIPGDSYAQITDFLQSKFTKYRVRRIKQQYPASENEPVDLTLKNAFQNLLLPSISYELFVRAKKDKGFNDYEILFNAEGSFIKMRKSLPANYDHILY